MSNSLFFKIKNTVDIDKHRLLEIFFKDWVDNSCNNEVQYKIERDWNKDRLATEFLVVGVIPESERCFLVGRYENVNLDPVLKRNLL